MRSLGGELAIFDSTVTSRLVSAYIRGQDYGRRAYWLGLTRTVWSWASGEHVDRQRALAGVVSAKT